MTKTSTLAIAALAVAALSLPAMAAQITVDTGTAAGAPMAAGAKTPTDMMLATSATSQAELDAIAKVGSTTKVHVVKITAAGNPMSNDLTKMKTDKAADITKLEAAINANASLKSELQANKVDVSQIVAAEVATDGTLTLYTLA